MPSTKIRPSVDDNNSKASSKVASSSTSKLNANKKQSFMAINIAIIFGVIVFIIGVIFIIIFAVAPCRFKSCHANATCINQPFNAKCKCKSGFNGNGIDCDECGVAYPGSVDSSLANDVPSVTGDPVPAFAFPASVFIQFAYVSYVQVGAREYESYYYGNCDGILINRRTVLTAASCIIQSYQFYIDDINQTVTVQVQLNNAFPEWGQMYNMFIAVTNQIGFYVNLWPIRQIFAQDIIVHEKYQASSSSYNVALIRLRDRLDLDQYVQLACIPDANDLSLKSSYLSYNNSAVSIGWEPYFRRGFGGIFDKYALASFSQNIFNVSNCTGLFTPNSSDFLICAGQYQFLPINANSTAGLNCQGDIGGALYINRSYNGIMKNFAVGLMINDTLCGLGVFTNLFNFVDWIADKSNY